MDKSENILDLSMRILSILFLVSPFKKIFVLHLLKLFLNNVLMIFRPPTCVASSIPFFQTNSASVHFFFLHCSSFVLALKLAITVALSSIVCKFIVNIFIYLLSFFIRITINEHITISSSTGSIKSEVFSAGHHCIFYLRWK